MKKRACFHCKEQGHMARECPNVGGKPKNREIGDDRSTISVGKCKDLMNRSLKVASAKKQFVDTRDGLYLTVQVGTPSSSFVRRKMLVDLGAQISVVTNKFLTEHFPEHDMTLYHHDIYMTGCMGDRQRILGHANLDIQLGTFKTKVKFNIVDRNVSNTPITKPNFKSESRNANCIQKTS